MSKIMKIKNCESCPNMEKGWDSRTEEPALFCMAKDEHINEYISIPLWCPLEEQSDTVSPLTAQLLLENRVMITALRRIDKWFGEYPDSLCGSNPIRDYMRNVARKALEEI